LLFAPHVEREACAGNKDSIGNELPALDRHGQNERVMVLGRKNYLFCGSDAGGRRAACIYTILETAKMNDVNPHAYLTDILAQIGDHPINKIDALLPWRWKT
jgi:hypothetical protein